MKSRFQSKPAPFAVLAGALLMTLSTSFSAQAQTTITSPGAREGTVAVTPGSPKRTGIPVIVAAVVDTTGNAENAKTALQYANSALSQTAGYDPLAASEYAPVSAALAKAGLDTDWGYPFTSTDFQKIGKASTAQRILTLEITPVGETFGATAELYDAKRGALVGFGKASGSSLENAVLNAIVKLGETASFSGIVVSRPAGYNARLSLGTNHGIRGGARVEYLDENGAPIAYGTIFDAAAGESLATVAPETAFPRIFVNQKVRVLDNPAKKRALPTYEKIAEEDFAKFEKSFGIRAGVAVAAYYIFGGS